jgi:UDP-N-acetylglucosamine 4-epimerase
MSGERVGGVRREAVASNLKPQSKKGPHWMSIYLVTGGAGFVGSHLVEALLQRNERVVVLDNFSTGLRRNLDGIVRRRGLAAERDLLWGAAGAFDREKAPGRIRLTVVEGDIRDLSLCRKAVQGADYVLHQAALPSVPRSIEDPLSTHAVNVDGTFNLLLAAKESRAFSGVPKRFVYASSSSVYGDTPVLPKVETMPTRPLSPYAASKLLGEIYCQVFSRAFGLPTVSLRYFNIYGPRQNPDSPYAAAIPKFITRLLSDQPPEVFGDGTQSRDFTFVDDCVQANLLACSVPDTASVSGEAFNVACGGRIEINRLCDLLAKLLGKDLSPRHLPPRPGDVRHSQADISKASLCLNYRPEFGIDDGLKKTLAAWSGEASDG